MSLNETNPDDQALALAALGWTLQDTGRAERLLGLTGLSPDDLRSRLEDRALLAEILRFLEGHEPDLIACAESLVISPARIVQARQALEK